jgi:uncharacterized membrane protein YfcA
MLELWQLPILFAVGLTAGFVDSVAGGGGLISLPVLLALGMEPKLALGTNKLQGACGSASATWHYVHAGAMRLRDCATGFWLTLAGSVVGALAVQQLDPALLRRLIPVLLMVIALVVWLRPQLGEQETPPRLPVGAFYWIAGLGLGFYDGFFGPGTGNFWAMAFVFGLGFNLTRATAHTKAMNFASNIGSLTFFALAGQVSLLPGITMGLGQLLGARLGARMVVTRGTAFIRPVFLSVVSCLTAKLLYDAYVQRK